MRNTYTNPMESSMYYTSKNEDNNLRCLELSLRIAIGIFLHLKDLQW